MKCIRQETFLNAVKRADKTRVCRWWKNVDDPAATSFVMWIHMFISGSVFPILPRNRKILCAGPAGVQGRISTLTASGTDGRTHRERGRGEEREIESERGRERGERKRVRERERLREGGRGERKRAERERESGKER
ncbi:hypothetical protein EVAR_95505_1 [Eumeta japonica]|uniref:Uncharacterized protein n=1 Tax=Eumeta variegata TaxID=151549 RepID=A0A4C1UKB3_EUMVA|nr:hypothetical protein EVAR_95505_1 [Eumeta japonica]